jgi:thioredoxin reductase
MINRVVAALCQEVAVSEKILDYLVLGAGPAGLQLGYYLGRAGRDYLVVEAGPTPGTFFQSFPRHRTLISVNKRHTGYTDPELNLRMDWNSLLSDDPALLFTRYSGKFFPPADELVRYLADFAKAGGLNVTYHTRITEITRGEHFRLRAEDGRTFAARRVVVATGMTLPNIPDVPGIDSVEHYPTVSVNPENFVDQRVLIIGKGNSAFETADNLMEAAAVIHVAGPGSVKFAWKTHFVGHLRAVNNNLLDAYQLKLQHAVLDGNIKKIEEDGDSYVVTFSFQRANEVIKDLRYDRVICCTGFRFDASIFEPRCRPELTIDDRFPALTEEWESTNIPDLYFAGTITQSRDFKRSTSGFIHGFRYSVRALHHMLELKHHGQQWPYHALAADPDALMAAVLTRVNRSSALYQQFAFLGDVVAVDRDGARYYEELSVDYAHTAGFVSAGDYFVVTLEYGPGHDKVDPFDVDQNRISQSDTETSHLGRYLHPVVRHYREAELLAEHHVTENLENEWTGPQHREPLRAFFARALSENVAPVR